MLAVFLAVAMTIIPAAAAPNSNEHTITIKNTDSSVEHSYVAYRVFEGNLDTTDHILSDIQWSTGVVAGQVMSALKSPDGNPEYYKDFANCTTAQDVTEVLVGYGNDSQKLDSFATLVSSKLRNAAGISTAVRKEVDGKQVIDHYTIPVTGDGYYFIKDADNSVTAEGESYTKYMLSVVHDVEIDAKDDHIVPEKKIIEDNNTPVDANSASIGETITYRVTVDIPKMEGYKAYTFTMNDTFSKGLDFQQIQSVMVANSTLVETDDYTVIAIENADGTTKLTVNFIDFIQYKGTSGQVVVTYTAKLDTDAVVGGEGNPNTVNFTYSNNPSTTGIGNGGSTGVTPDDETVTYTTALNLLKVDGRDNSIALQGAKFKIEGDGVNTVITTGTKFEKAPYTAGNNETVDNETYYLLGDGTYSTTAPDPAPEDTYVLVHFTKITTKSATVDCDGTTGPDGKTDFIGLSAGTYTLTEVESPDGYNLLPEPIEFGINWTASKGFTVAANEHNGITYDPTTGTFSITVENNKGSVLPHTGGIGTTIFMIVGGVLILGAAVVLVSVLVSRRKENN